MIVGKASTSPNDFLPLPTPNLPFSRTSSATEADEKPRRRPRRGSRRNQREDVAEEKIE